MIAFLHGVEVQELDVGPRPIAASNASVIGLVGTAKVPKDGLEPNIPVLIPGSRKVIEKYFPESETALFKARKELDDAKKAYDAAVAEDNEKDIAKAKTAVEQKQAAVIAAVQDFSKDETIRLALNGILDQTGAMIVVVRAKSSEQDDIKKAIEALKGAESEVNQTPRLLIAPGFSDTKAIRDKMAQVATVLRGIAIVDGIDHPEPTEVIKDNKSNNDPRMYLVYPPVKVSCGDKCVRIEPSSARTAGVIVRSDTDRGFWFSPSNQNMSGIDGTKYPIDFALDNPLSTANQLNEGRVTTIIHQNGYRLWGNRSTTADPKWVFISVRRTADIINDSLLRAHLWAVDRNITKTYVEDVTEGVNAFLRYLKKIGAIINGKCWADPEINTWDQVVQGKVTFDFDFTPPYPAEHITFRSRMVNDYIEEIFS